MRDDEKTGETRTGTATLDRQREDANRDPITGESGAYPVGTGVGAVGGAATGAAVGGAVGGPVGAMIGAAVGNVAGGLAGKGIAESVNPTEEEAYWRKAYSTRPYTANRTYDDLAPAYRYGWESKVRHADRRWNDVEGDLERGWDKAKASSRLGWHEAKDATRDAWHRVENALPGDADRDARGDHFTTGYSGLTGTVVRRSPLAVRLSELHDPETGRLDAARIAEYLRLSLKQFSEALGRNYSTVHRTPAGAALQEPLGSIKRSLVILEDVLGDRSSALAWLNSPHPDLGQRTPMAVLLEGHVQVIEDMLEGALEGIPS